MRHKIVRSPMVDATLKRAARVLTWVIGGTGAEPLVRKATAFGHFLVGQGAGSGWDAHGEHRALLRSLPPGDAPVTVMDIGANNGSWLEGLLKSLEPRGVRAIAVECAPIPLAHLRDRKLSSTIVIEAAGGNEVGKATLHCQSVGGGLASLIHREDTTASGFEWQEIEVRVVTVDSLMTDHGVERLDLLKIDVEGNEFAVLEGARAGIDSKRIGAIQFEFSSACVNSRVFMRDFWHLLSPNYTLTRLAPGGIEFEVRGYYEDLEYFRGATNYVARLRR